MLNDEFVTVLAGGMTFDGFERVQVSAGMDEAARSFVLETTERVGEWKFPPGTPIEIRANGDLLVRGYVNNYEASGDEKSHRISIKGRGKGQDFVDSAAEHDTGMFEKLDPGEIGKALDKFGVGINVKVPLEKIDYAQLAQGERAFEALERMLRPQGATMMGNADGSIDITNASAAKHHYGILMEGHNIKSFQVSLTDGGRHSKYIVKGQRRRGTGPASLRIRQSASDSGVRRHRPKIIVDENDSSPGRARARAEHEKERAAGKSVAGGIQTQGFRDFAGVLFEPNRLIYVHAPILMHLTQTMLIERVDFSQDRSGSLTQLTLVDPRAYKGKAPGKGVKSAPAPQPDAVPEPETDGAWTSGLDD